MEITAWPKLFKNSVSTPVHRVMIWDLDMQCNKKMVSLSKRKPSKWNYVPEGRNEWGRVAIPTSFSMFDSYDMKCLWFKFGYNIFTGLKMVGPYPLKVGMPVFLSYFMKWDWRPLGLKSWHFEVSADITINFSSQALHVIIIKHCNAGGSGNPPCFISTLLNIGILL